jgi:hypothetical protein
MRSALLPLALAVATLILPLAGIATAADTPKDAVINYLATWKNEGLPATAPLFSHESHSEVAGMMRDLLFAGPAEQSAAMRTTLIGPGSTRDSVAKMDEGELMKTFLTLNDMSMKRMRSGISVDSYSVLGAVEERPDTVHVVARTMMIVGEQKMDRVSVFSTERRNSKWYVSMQADMSAALRAMKRQLATQPSP